MVPEFSAPLIRKLARRLYADAPAFARQMAVHRATIAPINDVLNAVPHAARVLDVGCGNGLLLNVLAAAGLTSSGVGVDISEAAIRAAERAAATLPDRTRPHFAARPANTLLPDEPFDVVLLVDVMHHVPSAVQDAFLFQVGQRVRPGGRLVYKDMCRRPRWRAGMNRLHDAVVARQWVRYYPIERAAPTLGGAFTLVQSQDRRMLWYGHEMRVWHRNEPGGVS